MAKIEVRQASLDDTQYITRMFQARIPVWQRMTPTGQIENVACDALTVYERWLHGGAWMSVETASIHLGRLLLGAGLAFVAVNGGEPLAYVEAYHSLEPEPFGSHLHLARLVTHADHSTEGLEAALVSHLLGTAARQKIARVMISRVTDTPESTVFQTHYRLNTLARLRRVSIAARTGQIFYKATDHADANPAQINGWSMPVGRTSSARQQWEMLWARTWDALPEIRQRRTHRLHISSAGQEAFVCCRQQLHDARSADVYCWSPKPLSNQLLSAIRDWSHREGYRTLVMTIGEETLKVFGAEAEPDIYTQDVCEVLPL